MVDIRLRGKPLAQRIADQLRSSGEGTNADERAIQRSLAGPPAKLIDATAVEVEDR